MPKIEICEFCYGQAQYAAPKDVNSQMGGKGDPPVLLAN
jgi:hypothetical protein